MATYTSEMRAKPSEFYFDQKRRHSLWVLLGGIAAAGIAILLYAYGADYYALDQAHRPFSAKHYQLKPSGTLGIRLGLFALLIFFLIYLYPIRKRWPWLGRIGKTKHWLDYHVLFGLFAPLIVSLHASFKFQGIAGTAYWTMIALTTSGIAGRYLYAQIPKNLSTAEGSLKKMQEQKAQFTRQLEGQSPLLATELQQLFRLPDSKEVLRMPLWRTLFVMLKLDLIRSFRIWRVRRQWGGVGGRYRTLGGILPCAPAQLEHAISIAKKESSISKQILFLSKSQQVFHLWHVIHRPFSISFAVLVILHIAIVLSLGYY